MKKKNIYILHFQGVSTPFMPLLWPSAKTYFEKKGKHLDKFNWVLPTVEIYNNLDKIKEEIRKSPPDLFGVGLYIWNFELSLEVCKWVKEEFPNCIIITGGPHQYYKFHKEWFVKHNFIDASLPSEVYGEIAIADTLYEMAENNVVNWNNVESAVYPLSFDKSCWLQSTKSTYKRNFEWDFSAYDAQKEHLLDYINYFENEKNKTNFSKNLKTGLVMYSSGLHWKLETTRGCPYSCTFCDWGGGVMSKVVLKSLESVKKDINVILNSQKDVVIYMCDANFGINGERDVEIVQYIADLKNKNKVLVDLHYGGYAKTHTHFDTLKEIFNIEGENLLSNHYKISIQSFHEDILQNIKRTDLRKEEHWELADYLKDTFNYDSFVELIIGLPGTTIDKWCEEFTVPYEKNSVVRAYEWHLLPESEGYDPKYREKYKIGTSKKLMNKSEWHIPTEVVVESFSYNREDYKVMWTIYTIYELIFRGGIYKQSIKEVLTKNNITFGQLLKKFYYDCYNKMKEGNKEIFDYFEQHLNYLIDGNINDYRFVMECKIKGKVTQLNFPSFLLLEYFINFDYMDQIVRTWLKELGASEKTIRNDNLLILSEDRLNKTKIRWNKFIRYTKYKNYTEYLNELNVLWLYELDTLIAKEWTI